VAQALAHHTQAIAIARQLGAAHHVASVLDHLSSTLALAGRAGEALAPIEEALQISAGHEVAPANASHQQLQYAVVCRHLGRHGDALAALDRADALAHGYSRLHAGRIALHRGLCWAELGQWSRAKALLTQAQAQPDLHAYTHAQMHRLAWLLSQGLGHPDPQNLHRALAAAPEHPHQLHALLQIDCAQLLPPAQALDQLEALRQALAPRGLDGHVLTAHLRSAQLALPEQPGLAREHALRALALARTRQPTGATAAELWLHAGRALLAAGDSAQAARVLAEGRATLLATAQRVPPAFRNSFLHRQHDNMALLALATRHGTGTAAPVTAGPPEGTQLPGDAA
jgi:tetratricopeptide (TPR) repeat protein